MKFYVEQICQWVFFKEYKVFGIDGFGCSDSCKKLCNFFEVDCYWVVLVVFEVLVDCGDIELKVVVEVIVKYGIDLEKCNLLDC